jgi:hypothetical protein
MADLAAHVLLPESVHLLEELLPLPIEFVPNVQNQQIKRGVRGGTTLKSESDIVGEATTDIDEVSRVDDTVVLAPISKAASRMRQYRAEHKNDLAWLSKEAERMRKMRAKRKSLTEGEILPAPALDESGNLIERPAKIKRTVTAKAIKVGDSKAECAVENFDAEIDAPTDDINIAAAANLVERNLKRTEFRKKEAERIRKYRALKRQDQVWKDKDAERMRLYRAKRKSTSAKMEPKTEDPILLEATHCAAPALLEFDYLTIPHDAPEVSSQSNSSESALQHDLIEVKIATELPLQLPNQTLTQPESDSDNEMSTTLVNI